MKEEDLVAMRKYSRVFPEVPFSRHTPHTGVYTCGANAANNTTPSEVVILGIFCSVKKDPIRHNNVPVCRPVDSERLPSTPSHKRSRDEMDSPDSPPPPRRLKLSLKPKNSDHHEAQEQLVASATAVKETNAGDNSTATGKTRHIYIRVMYNKSIVETLPLEIMRVRHPQILIDYLLSTTVWQS
ncbi:hypothetical protein, conserved [Angomonas deanei]|uniref:Uncharacterized protein n=1 Tax=Angomonas deanei TaxID=59799 RepID=A0A7G2CG68_9TRYP|nr:hypothetical protein, conserved [Angomonas deanei]